MILKNFQRELRLELDSILKYWSQHVVDLVHGGFAGRLMKTTRPILWPLKGLY